MAVKNLGIICGILFCFVGCQTVNSSNPKATRETSSQNESIQQESAFQSESSLGNTGGSKSLTQEEQTEYIPWKQRFGPAYPEDCWRSVGRDGKEFLPKLGDDTLALAKNPWSLAFLGAAGAAGIALHGANADDPIANHYEKEGPQLNSFWDSIGDAGGNPGTHFAIAGLWYAKSLMDKNDAEYEHSTTLLRALALNGILTSVLKVSARTEAPNGNENVWPSGHTSSSFTLATVMWDAYGPLVGAPFMGFAGYVGYERIDAGNHQFSDVLSGALIGVAVGHAVSDNHQIRIAGFTLEPFLDVGQNTAGIALAKRW